MSIDLFTGIAHEANFATEYENSRSNNLVRHFAQGQNVAHGQYFAHGQSFQRKLESMPVLALSLKEDGFQLSLE